jgi:hypothetical protein
MKLPITSAGKEARMAKYNSKKVTRDGMTFDSVKEYKRYCELRLLEKAGAISNLQRQVEFELIPAQREPDTVGVRGGIKRGKVIEKAVKYVADFVYTEDGRMIVEDVKSPATKTRDYIIKRKIMLWAKGITIREV